MPFTSNYSFKNIIKQLRNYEFLNDSSSTYSRGITLDFSLDVEFDRLDYQADVFASSYSQHGYIQFSTQLRCQQSDVVGILKNMYIYSFVKALHNGLYFNRINKDTYQGLCMRGHAALYQMLRNPSFSTNEEDYFVQAKLFTPSEREKKILFSLLIKRYPFLTDALSSIDSVGNTPFFHHEWEARLANLNDNRYSRNFIINSESGDNQIKSKNSSIKDDAKNDRGRLILLDLSDNVAASILDINNNPITNVLLPKNGDEIYFTPVNGNYKLENNCSFFFNIANFIRYDKINGSVEPANIYFRNEYSMESKMFFIASEVFTNTGIKCIVPGYLKQRQKDTPSLFNELKNRIKDWVEGTDIEMMIETILSEIKKEIEQNQSKEDKDDSK